MDQNLITEEFSDLTESIRAGKTIAFVGSGLSLGEYCSWRELVTKLCAVCGIILNEENNDVDLLELAEQAKNASVEGYCKVLSDEFGKEHPHIPPGYNYLLESPFAGYITVNYDPLLAEVNRFKRFDLYNFKNGLDSSRLKNKAIFYIHGFVPKGGVVGSDDLILTKSDFDNNYEAAGAIIPSFLTQVLTFKPVVFLGCGLQEPALRKILKLSNEIKRRIEAGATHKGPTHHILLPTLYTRQGENDPPKRDIAKEEEEREKYEEDGVQVIRYVRESPDDFRPVEKILEHWSGAPEVRMINVYDEEGPSL